MSEILVLYYSATGSVRALAQAVSRGVESVEGMRARVRTVPKVASVVDKVVAAVPSEGAPYVEARDLAECAGLALGSPTRFGNMAAMVSGPSGCAARSRASLPRCSPRPRRCMEDRKPRCYR